MLPLRQLFVEAPEHLRAMATSGGRLASHVASRGDREGQRPPRSEGEAPSHSLKHGNGHDD